MLGERKALTINSTGAILDVVNLSGAVLPDTGGIGTILFYVIGGLLMAGAVVVLVARKKTSGSR